MIVMLTGANDFAIRQALDKIVGAYLNKFGVHAIERVDGESFDPARLSELLQGASLFASQRLVVLRDASKNKSLWEAMGDWTERVPAEVTLVLVETSPDKRTRTYKQLQKHAEVRDFPELAEPELARWLVATAKDVDANIDHKSAAYLVRQVGADQWRLHTELQKLAAYNPTITVESVDELVEPSPQATAFELLDNVLQGNAAKASDLLNRLRASEDPYKLFGLLVSQAQTLALVVTAGGKPADAVAKEAGIHPFVVRKMQPLTRSISYAKLQEIVVSIASTDVNLKSSGVDPWILLGQCLGKIASKI